MMELEDQPDERCPALRQDQQPSTVWMSDMLRPLVQSRHKEDSGIGCRAPRRVLRMLFLGAVVPLALVGAALHARLVLYTPQTLATAPSDQRLLHAGISSFWCQGQSVTMNGSFNAFVVESTPKLSTHRPRHALQRQLQLRDDVKEYWGFYLHRGSTISLRTCARFEGGQLMILRGLSNLRRCAWIGRRDSSESQEESDEQGRIKGSNGEDVTDNFVHMMRTIWKKLGSTSDQNTTNSNLESNERMTEIDNLLNKAISLSKDRMEIMHSLYRQANSIFTGAVKEMKQPKTQQILKNNSSEIKNQQSLNKTSKISNMTANLPDLSQDTKTTKNTGEATITIQNVVKHADSYTGRKERSVKERENLKRAIEEIDKNLENKTVSGRNGLAELLAFQSSAGDSSEGDGDFSESSSEEALSKCEGILLNEVIQPSLQCSESLGRESIQVTYDIPVTDTFYFVFSSDNEIVPNLIYFNLTLDRAVFDTEDAKQKCLGVGSCSLPIEFLSDNLVVVDVLESENTKEEESYVLYSECQPRVPIYLSFVLVVPMFILTCASR